MPKKVYLRKKLFKDEILITVERLASYGLEKKQIAHCLGVQPGTFYHYIGKHPDVQIACDKGKAVTISKVARKLLGLIIGRARPDFSAIAFFLKNQAGWQDTKSQGGEAPSLQINLLKDYDNTAKTITPIVEQSGHQIESQTDESPGDISEA